jgi:hypothetical protein
VTVTVVGTDGGTAYVSTLRPPLGPGLIGKYEHELAAFDGLGLTDVQMDDCLQRPYRWHASPG